VAQAAEDWITSVGLEGREAATLAQYRSTWNTLSHQLGRVIDIGSGALPPSRQPTLLDEPSSTIWTYVAWVCRARRMIILEIIFTNNPTPS
jgi:hypothetical protein